MKKERQEQIIKHKRTIEHDRKVNRNGQLVTAAMWCVELAEKNSLEFYHWPWDERSISNHITLKKSPLEKVVIAGAFLMAEQDRIEAKIYWQEIMQLAWLYERIAKQK